MRVRMLIAGALVCAPAMAGAQQYVAPPVIDSLKHASLAVLGKMMPDTDSVYVRTVVSSPDPEARMNAANSVRVDSASAPFIMAFLVQEHDPKAIKYPLFNVYAYPYFQRDPTIRVVLKYLMETSTDSEVVYDAMEQLRSIEMRELETTMTARINAAKAAGNDALVQTLLASQDRAVTLERGIMLPTFMRRAPKLFTKSVRDPKAIRVLAFGDFGFHFSPDEKTTSKAMATYGRAHPYDFGITLGDNFYGTGLGSPDDSRWRTEYEPQYGTLGIQIFPSFGNHDQYDGDSPPSEILYSGRSRSWHFPAQFYTYTAGPAQFYVIDTNDPSEVQLSWLKSALEASHAKWKIVYGHFPMYMSTDWSKGRFTDTTMVREFMPILQGRADVYLSGHYHSLQHLKPVNGVNLFVSAGGGASSYDVYTGADSTVLFAKKAYGFSVLDITDTTFTLRFVDEAAKVIYTATLKK
jgi:tartrate-resistant acid phosphatase type 5